METETHGKNDPLFAPISGDDTGLTEISSMCPNCEDEVY